ncbi:hypothetical protein DPMN_105014 [Dreissena polymorpha]|uniref:G-protein coupled receptors family 1 profile domain-containing protein n=1 Tax=Dreissena polymorpha TaxID=45954 RepID=A0A9D4H8S8_DREPO|nr:hypothetical protein DPMN_105014 [Dreissena polymorpha]
MPEVGDKTARWYLSLIVLTPVILLGLVGNCLSMLTWSRGSNRNKSTAVLLTCLAVTDTIVLAIPALEMWADEVFNFKLRLPHVVLCKLFAWASYFGPTMSSWIIVLVTLERFVSIWFPVRVRYLCTKVKMRIAIISVGLILAFVYSPFLILTDIRPTNETGMLNGTKLACDVNYNTTFFLYYVPVWMWIDFVLLFGLPFVIVVIGNVMILYKIFKSRKAFSKKNRHVSERTRAANSFTMRAIALSIILLVCLLPVTSKEVYHSQTGTNHEGLLQVVVSVLLYANSALNFLLYCAIGTGFRTDMKKVLRSLCSRRRVSLNYEETTRVNYVR